MKWIGMKGVDLAHALSSYTCPPITIFISPSLLMMNIIALDNTVCFFINQQ